MGNAAAHALADGDHVVVTTTAGHEIAGTVRHITDAAITLDRDSPLVERTYTMIPLTAIEAVQWS